MDVHRTDIPLRLKYLRQIFFKPMIHTIGRLLYLKELPSSNVIITHAEKNALRKELLVCCMQVLHSRCNFASLLLSSFQTLFQLLQQQCDMLNEMKGAWHQNSSFSLLLFLCKGKRWQLVSMCSTSILCLWL